MNKMTHDRIQLITECIQTQINPTQLEVIDDSHLHVGHVGAQTGKGHFTVIIQAPIFHGQSKLECHRIIYAALGNLLETDIHALSIKIKSI